MKVRFLERFRYVPSLRRQVETDYPKGWSGTVKRECGEQAIQEGKALEIEPLTGAREDEGRFS